MDSEKNPNEVNVNPTPSLFPQLYFCIFRLILYINIEKQTYGMIIHKALQKCNDVSKRKHDFQMSLDTSEIFYFSSR